LKGIVHQFKGVKLIIIRKTARYFARKEFCMAAIQEHADLSIFKEKLTATVITGLILIVVSSPVGLPAAVIIGGFVAVKYNALIAAVITTLIYGISWLLFMLGLYLAGPKYGKAVSRWAVRVVLEKIFGDEAKSIGFVPVENPGKPA